MQGKNYLISVGEPWDFDSPDGQNIIKGSILKIVSATCLVFKSNYVLNFPECSGNTLVLYPRYSAEDFNNLGNNKDYVPINGNLLLDNFDQKMSEDYLKERSRFVIAGSIRI